MSVDLEPEDGWSSTSFYVRNVPPEVKLKFKAYASMMGQTMSAILIAFMREAGRRVRPHSLALILPPDPPPIEDFFDVDAFDHQLPPDFEAIGNDEDAGR